MTLVLEQKGSKLVLAGLLLAILMSAMDNTIVATALGAIVADLNGADKFVWVTSAYMVAVMAGMPIFGKLSDMYGRKKFFVFGLFVFLLGSVLCGLSQSIVQLSIFRAIQGIGGGALMPIAFTIVFDIFPPEARGKMTGLLGAVFGSSSVFGPLIGAFLTDNFSWHWIFYVNLPIGLLSLIFILGSYKESPERSDQRIDWGGAITLVVAVVSLMFGLEFGGKEYAWTSWQILSLFAGFLIFFIAFLMIERKAAEPIISFWMFKKPLFASAQALAFLYGATFIILTILIPIFVQAVYGGSATNAGLVLTPLMLGSVVGSAVAGIAMSKTSYRNIMWISIISFIIGMALLSTVGPDTSRWLLTIYMVISGFGVGFSFSLLPNATIHKLEPRYRGSANSTNSFFRSLGMTIGITLFGAMQSKFFSSNLEDAFGKSGGMASGDSSSLFSAEMRDKIPDEVLSKITQAMSDSITHTFAYALIPLGIAVVFVYLMGKSRLEISKAKPKKG